MEVVAKEKCKYCKFCGNASDLFGVKKYDCLYDLAPDKDEDGFVILAPPCDRNSEVSDPDAACNDEINIPGISVENLPFS